MSLEHPTAAQVADAARRLYHVATNYALEVKAGELATIDFGAQESMAIAEVPQADTVSRSPVLLVVGLVILLGGLGLGYYLWRQRKV